MSSSFGYLIPTKTFEIGQFKQLITSILESQEIIDGFYEEEYQWFAAGKNSHSIFKEHNDDTNPALSMSKFMTQLTIVLFLIVQKITMGQGVIIAKRIWTIP